MAKSTKEIKTPELPIPPIFNVKEYEWNNLIVNRNNFAKEMRLITSDWEVFQFLTPFGASDQIMVVLRREIK